MPNLDRLAANLADVQRRIAAAAYRVGRNAEEITLIAVTKYVDVPTIRALFDLGVREFGESRPQALWEKAAALSDLPLHWHFVGHLQRNKVDRTFGHVAVFHSGDSLRILQALEEIAAKENHPANVLVEINISGDATKHGFAPHEVEALLPNIAKLPYVNVLGLMGMASREGDLDQARREFAALRALRDQLQKIAPERILLNKLSLGMSGDFEVAIEEGATMVRIGSALFEGVIENT